MILVDSNVWIDYFRDKNKAKALTGLLESNQVACHPWVIAELCLGDLGEKRKQVISYLSSLNSLQEYSISELIPFTLQERLFSTGLSLVDLQILYSCIKQNVKIWTKDKALKKISMQYKISFLEI